MYSSTTEAFFVKVRGSDQAHACGRRDSTCMGFSCWRMSWERLDEMGLALGNKVFFIPSLGPDINWFWKPRQHLAGSVHGGRGDLPFVPWKHFGFWFAL